MYNIGCPSDIPGPNMKKIIFLINILVKKMYIQYFFYNNYNSYKICNQGQHTIYLCFYKTLIILICNYIHLYPIQLGPPIFNFNISQ